ncbi:hypothetical protein ABPG74_018998, partial [Tetrahymena malaccensis]
MKTTKPLTAFCLIDYLNECNNYFFYIKIYFLMHENTISKQFRISQLFSYQTCNIIAQYYQYFLQKRIEKKANRTIKQQKIVAGFLEVRVIYSFYNFFTSIRQPKLFNKHNNYIMILTGQIQIAKNILNHSSNIQILILFILNQIDY